jgi:Protein of unknown function (DUF1552)
MKAKWNRRRFLKTAGASAGLLPFVTGLSSLRAESVPSPKKRLILMFSPNGVIMDNFWPDATGEGFALKEILSPLEPFKAQLLVMNGICNKVRGDGDSHMRGMSCLLTAIELFPGNIQGGSDTPAGWPKGISIDQEIKNFLQTNPETQTRFGSLEFGVVVPKRADPWTRWVYAGSNRPIAPIDDPYQMFAKMYGQLDDQESLKSILDDLQEELKQVRKLVGGEDRHRLNEHTQFVREMEHRLAAAHNQAVQSSPPELIKGIRNENDNMPELSKMQIDLLVNGFRADMNRIATLQFTNSVGDARMKWLGIEEGHHQLSHDPDLNKESQEKLTKINKWYCEQLAYLCQRLAETPETDGEGNMLDHTTVIWTNELGKGNSHTLDNIPFVAVGNGLGFKMGRSLDFRKVPHNRLWLSLAHAFGHNIETFGNVELSKDGSLSDLV